LDYKFLRAEKGKVMVLGISSEFSDIPDFSGFSITPFIGYLFSL